MILLDCTPGHPWPSWVKSAKPDSMKGKFCIPHYWEIGKCYANGQWYHFVSLQWWPKGANFLIEIKYHLLRALFTSGLHSSTTVLFDQFDGGSENRNFPNLAFLSELVNRGLMDEVQGSRLLTGHSHNEGDGHITAPRKACENTACRSFGDVVEAMYSATTKKPIIVFVRDIHDWVSRANAVKNPHLQHVCSPYVWKLTKSDPPGLEYKDSYRSQDWLGADGIPGGRPVDLLANGEFPLDNPELVPRFVNPFSDSAVASTRLAIKQLQSNHPDIATQLTSVLSTGGSDKSLGLQYTRQFSPGKIGFPGSLTTSNGGIVHVRVISGLPSPLWEWEATAPPMLASPLPVDTPRTVVRDRKQARAAPAIRVPWTCHCGKVFKRGQECKHARSHRDLKLPRCDPQSASRPIRKRNSRGDPVPSHPKKQRSGSCDEDDEEDESDEEDEADEEDEEAEEEDEEEDEADEENDSSEEEQQVEEAEERSEEQGQEKQGQQQGMEDESSQDVKAGSTSLAEDILRGDRCGHCREELSDSDEVFECTFKERRKKGKSSYVYDCDHAFHRSCVLQDYKQLYTRRELNCDAKKWKLPENWSCPSCKGCVYAKRRWRNTDHYFFCMHCDSKFVQSEAKARNMLCFYCQLHMFYYPPL